MNDSLQEIADVSFAGNLRLQQGAEQYGMTLCSDMANTIMDVAAKLGIELKPPLDFAFDSLPKGLHAYVTDLDRKIVISDQSLEQAILQANRGELEYAKAILRALATHEMFHISQMDKYPQVMKRESNVINNNQGVMTTYHLSRSEQGAELFTIKYLEELDEVDPKQKEANLAVAKKLRSELNRNLQRSRIKRFLTKMFRKQ